MARYNAAMKRLLVLLAVLLFAGPVLVGCDYYRVDPSTGKRYTISRDQYKRGIDQNEKNASFPMD